AMISDDPVFAFGTRLRQARFTAADFALDRLNHPSAIGNFASSATATWMAYDFGATQKRLRSAHDAERAAELYQGYTEQEIADRVTMLYYRALLAESQVTAAQANLQRSREIAGDVRDRVHSGLSLEADAMRAEMAARNAEDDLASARTNVQISREDLSEAIGSPMKDLTLLDSGANAQQDGMSSTSLSARQDLQAMDLQRASAEQNLSAIRRSRAPKFSTYAHAESNNPHFTGGGSANWMVGGKLELSIFDGGVRKGQEQEASAQIAKITAQKAQTEIAARSRIRELGAQIADLERRYATAGDAIRVDEEALHTSRNRYAAGLVPVSDVLDRESDLASANLTRIRIHYQLTTARTDLQLADGTLNLKKAGQHQ
ncbi:MAG TPA: TolC family protein, partial [Edaphobacter sp.]|nr:TolC family protein [Edaphobacter sp.]